MLELHTDYAIVAIHNFKNWNGKIILDVIEKETISKIKKVIDSHFIVAIGEKSILIWNTLNDFNLNNEFGLVWFQFFPFFLEIYFRSTNTWAATFFGILSKLIKNIISNDLQLIFVNHKA